MSLRTKLVGALVALSVVTSVVVGLLSYRATSDQLRSEVDASLVAAVRPVAPERPRGRPGVRRSPNPVVDIQVLAPSGETRVAIGSDAIAVTAAAERLASADRGGIRRFSESATGDVEMRVLTVSIGDGRGAVQAARSLEEVNRVLSALRRRILLVTVIVATVAAIIGVVVGNSVTRRLLRLSGVAEHVGSSGDLAARVPQDGGDEVASLGASFNAMLATLQRSEQEQQRLVQDAGHELRTPMTSLRTNLYSLRGFEDLDEPTRRSVTADLESEAAELARLVEDVLQIAEGTASEGPPARFDLAEVVRSESVRTGARWDRAVEVNAPESLEVVGGRTQLLRVVRNLVDNACKFSEAGLPVEVTLSSGDGADGTPGALLEVLDGGVGFDEGDEDAAFARFHRSARARSLPGSGLGLSIVAEVTERHHGSVRAANREGAGAVVSVWLPLDAS